MTEKFVGVTPEFGKSRALYVLKNNHDCEIHTIDLTFILPSLLILSEITYKKFLFVFSFHIGHLNGPLHLNGTSFPSITIIVDNVPELRALLLKSRKSFRLVK